MAICGSDFRNYLQELWEANEGVVWRSIVLGVSLGGVGVMMLRVNAPSKRHQKSGRIGAELA